jgi:hypothetical protein
VTDHDALARRDPPPGGRGGTGGTAGGRDAGGEAGPGDAAGGDAAADGREDAPTEPPGPNRLTLLHGAVDVPRLAFCALRMTDAGTALPLEPPFPAGGLAYATPLALDAIPGVDLASEGLRLIAVAADAVRLETTRCADVAALIESAPADAGASDAAAPALRARGLPVLPAGTLVSERSLLLVVTGCFGGPDHDGPARELVCGKDYAPDRPTLGMTLVTMSRRTLSGRLGLQVLHASRATDVIGLVASPPPTIVGPSHYVASEVRYGQIAPRLANVQHSRADYGSPLEAALLDVRRQDPNGISQPWGEVLARGGVGLPRDGENFTIVLLGPLPGSSEPWANPTALTIAASDPK